MDRPPFDKQFAHSKERQTWIIASQSLTGDIIKTPMQSPDPSPSDEQEDDSQWQAHDQHVVDSKSSTPAADAPTDSADSAPMQKRRRVTRACDECRRKKIKCDGKQVTLVAPSSIDLSNCFSLVRIVQCIATVQAFSKFHCIEHGH